MSHVNVYISYTVCFHMYDILTFVCAYFGLYSLYDRRTITVRASALHDNDDDDERASKRATSLAPCTRAPGFVISPNALRANLPCVSALVCVCVCLSVYTCVCIKYMSSGVHTLGLVVYVSAAALRLCTGGFIRAAAALARRGGDTKCALSYARTRMPLEFFFSWVMLVVVVVAHDSLVAMVRRRCTNGAGIVCSRYAQTRHGDI